LCKNSQADRLIQAVAKIRVPRALAVIAGLMGLVAPLASQADNLANAAGMHDAGMHDAGMHDAGIAKSPEVSEIVGLSPLASDSAASSGSGAIEGLSDTQLTRLAADWSALDDSQRTELFQETRERMQPQAAPTKAPSATKTTQRRRYGRLVRQADGSVVRSVVEIETRVRVQGGDRRHAFGTGFERRHNPQLTTPVNSQAPGKALPNGVRRISGMPAAGSPQPN